MSGCIVIGKDDAFVESICDEGTLFVTETGPKSRHGGGAPVFTKAETICGALNNDGSMRTGRNGVKAIYNVSPIKVFWILVSGLLIAAYSTRYGAYPLTSHTDWYDCALSTTIKAETIVKHSLFAESAVGDGVGPPPATSGHILRYIYRLELVLYRPQDCFQFRQVTCTYGCYIWRTAVVLDKL